MEKILCNQINKEKQFSTMNKTQGNVGGYCCRSLSMSEAVMCISMYVIGIVDVRKQWNMHSM